MRVIGSLCLVVLFATTGLAVDKAKRAGAGTLAREATPGRIARLAEIAKDATPPKAGKRKSSADDRKANDNSVRIPIGR